MEFDPLRFMITSKDKLLPNYDSKRIFYHTWSYFTNFYASHFSGLLFMIFFKFWLHPKFKNQYRTCFFIYPVRGNKSVMNKFCCSHMRSNIFRKFFWIKQPLCHYRSLIPLSTFKKVKNIHVNVFCCIVYKKITTILIKGQEFMQTSLHPSKFV